MTSPTIIVTGASRGIGRSIVLLAIKNLGANVVGVARSQESLQQLSSHIEGELQLKDRFKFVVGDVTAESTAKDVVSLALNSWSGRIDGLAVNAGVISPLGTIANTSVSDWKQSKAALKMFGETLAKEEPEVTTVSIRPGVVDTEMQSAIRTKGVGNMVPDQHAKFVSYHTSKELLHPDEPGHVIASLSVKAPNSINGRFFSWNDEELKEHRK
ncbi:hypothetical protein BGZ79_008955 [Entomortierella chlamydospora]|nr:hypothetical protein BGZ79_008955 [Entomortierella chlamydospora]